MCYIIKLLKAEEHLSPCGAMAASLVPVNVYMFIKQGVHVSFPCLFFMEVIGYFSEKRR